MLKFINEIQRAVEQAQVQDVRERQKLISLLVANHIAYCLSLPSGAVNSAKLYFGENHGEWVKDMISEFNENMVINTKITYAVTESIWTMRYRLVYEPRHTDVVDFFVRMMASSSRPEIPNEYNNVVHLVDPETVERLNYYIGKSFKAREAND